MRLRTVPTLIAVALLIAMSAVEAGAEAVQRRLFYVGLALYSETWSQNDVVALSDELQRNSDFAVVPLIASNYITAQRQYPVADDARITTLVRTAAMRAGPDDVVVVHISTHG